MQGHIQAHMQNSKSYKTFGYIGNVLEGQLPPLKNGKDVLSKTDPKVPVCVWFLFVLFSPYFPCAFWILLLPHI